jgi:hypothetical protein
MLRLSTTLRLSITIIGFVLLADLLPLNALDFG